jgi:hypothetical protein
MRIPTRPLSAALVALTLVAAACSGDDDQAAESTVADDVAATPSVTPVATTVPPPILSSDLPLATVPPIDSADILAVPPPVDSADVPIFISVTVGVDSAVDRIDTVPLGATVSITVVNPNADDEFHLHGFDLGDGQEIPAGQNQTFTFTANLPGQYELESHSADQVLMILKVA